MARPDLKDCPAETEFSIFAENIRIPNDAVARNSIAGVLGPPFADIDASRASGTAVVNHATLKTETSPDVLDLDTVLKRLDKILQECEANVERREKSSGAPRR